MAKSINKVILIGNLGSDPELRATISGTYIANVNLATSYNWKDKQTGETKEHTEWHKLVFYNRLADVVGKYLSKGHKIYVEGHLRTRKWQDQTGIDHYVTEVIVDEMQMLGSKAPTENVHEASWHPNAQTAAKNQRSSWFDAEQY